MEKPESEEAELTPSCCSGPGLALGRTLACSLASSSPSPPALGRTCSPPSNGDVQLHLRLPSQCCLDSPEHEWQLLLFKKCRAEVLWRRSAGWKSSAQLPLPAPRSPCDLALPGLLSPTPTPT